jgi:hypothetical protein
VVGSGGPGCGGHTLKSSSSDTAKTIELGHIELVTMHVYSVAFVVIRGSRLLTPSGIQAELSRIYAPEQGQHLSILE